MSTPLNRNYFNAAALVVVIAVIVVIVGLALMFIPAARLPDIRSADPAAGAHATVLSDLALQHQRMVLAAINHHSAERQTLEDSQKRLNEMLQVLLQGGTIGKCKLSQPGSSLGPELVGLQKKLGVSQSAAKFLIDNGKQIDTVRNSLGEIEPQVEPVQALIEQLVQLKVKNGAKLSEIVAVQQLQFLLHRLAGNAVRMAKGGGVAPEVAFWLGKDINTMDTIIQGLANGSDLLGLPAAKEGAEGSKVLELGVAFGRIKTPVYQGVLTNLQVQVAARQAQMTLLEDNEAVLVAIQKLRNQLPPGETCSLAGG